MPPLPPLPTRSPNCQRRDHLTPSRPYLNLMGALRGTAPCITQGGTYSKFVLYVLLLVYISNQWCRYLLNYLYAVADMDEIGPGDPKGGNFQSLARATHITNSQVCAQPLVPPLPTLPHYQLPLPRRRFLVPLLAPTHPLLDPRFAVRHTGRVRVPSLLCLLRSGHGPNHQPMQPTDADHPGAIDLVR